MAVGVRGIEITEIVDDKIQLPEITNPSQHVDGHGRGEMMADGKVPCPATPEKGEPQHHGQRVLEDAVTAGVEAMDAAEIAGFPPGGHAAPDEHRGDLEVRTVEGLADLAVVVESTIDDRAADLQYPDGHECLSGVRGALTGSVPPP